VVCGVGYSWLSCGLIGDGSYYLFDAATVGPYKDVGHERAVPNLLAQLPLAAALAAGVTCRRRHRAAAGLCRFPALCAVRAARSRSLPLAELSDYGSCIPFFFSAASLSGPHSDLNSASAAA
jgi:hypothetical protein